MKAFKEKEKLQEVEAEEEAKLEQETHIALL